MGIRVYIFIQSLAEDIYSVVFGYSHEVQTLSSSHLRTADQSRREVGINVGLLL